MARAAPAAWSADLGVRSRKVCSMASMDPGVPRPVRHLAVQSAHARPGEHHPAFEEYCECIFELDEDDVDVIQARIAERLQVSPPGRLAR